MLIMKKILITFLSLLLFCPLCFAFDALDVTSNYEFDYRFIDNPFEGQKMVSDKEFEQALEQATPKPRKGFWNWIFRKEAPEPAPVVDFRLPNEMNSFNDVLNKKPVIIIGPAIFDAEGNVLPPGHYQVSYKENNLELSQGTNVVGKLKARPSKDDYESSSIIYARILEVNENFVKIIYANIDGTHEGYARIKKY